MTYSPGHLTVSAIAAPAQPVSHSKYPNDSPNSGPVVPALLTLISSSVREHRTEVSSKQAKAVSKLKITIKKAIDRPRIHRPPARCFCWRFQKNLTASWACQADGG